MSDHAPTVNATATINVRTGAMRVTVPGATDVDFFPHKGRNLGTVDDIEPWGDAEEDLTRADTALGTLGWSRTGEWVDDIGTGETFTTTAASV